MKLHRTCMRDPIRDTLASAESMRTLGEALRAQTHEHGNRLHTAVALLELGRTDGIRSPRDSRLSGCMRRSTMFGASKVPLGVTTNTSGRCRKASRSTSCPSRQGRASARCIHG